MAFVLADRVRETTASTGTGSVTLGGAYTGFQTFLVGIGNANNTYYTIANIVTGEWEVGIGTYTSSGNTLSRDTVLASSNSGSLVNFAAGSKDVFVTQPAERNVYVTGTDVIAANNASVKTTYGGTGVTTYTAGDTLYYATGTALSKLAIGAAGTIQTSTGTAPQWVASLNLSQGGTGLTSFTAGDLVYFASGTSFTKLGIGTNGQVLTSSGTAPQWTNASSVGVTTISFGTTGLTPATATSGAVTVAGTLAIANGGTGATTVSGAQTSLQVDPAGTAIAMAIALG